MGIINSSLNDLSGSCESRNCAYSRVFAPDGNTVLPSRILGASIVEKLGYKVSIALLCMEGSAIQ